TCVIFRKPESDATGFGRASSESSNTRQAVPADTAGSVAVKAYVSGPLTGVEPDPRPIYEHAAEVLERRGLDAYVPHKATDPKLHPNVTAAEVYARDRFHVLSADLVIAFLAPPSLGVGIELELAAAALLPVIALQPKGSVVSRMARGVPTRIFGPHEYETRGNV